MSCKIVFGNVDQPVNHKKRRLEKNGILKKIPFDIFSFTYTFLPYQDMLNVNLTNRTWHKFSHDIPGYINNTYKADIETMFTFPGSNDASKMRFINVLPQKLDMKNYEGMRIPFFAIGFNCFIKGEPINRRTPLTLLQTPLNRAATIVQAIQLAKISSEWGPVIEECSVLIKDKDFQNAFLITQHVMGSRIQNYLFSMIFNSLLTQYKQSNGDHAVEKLFIELFNQINMINIKDRIISEVIGEKAWLLGEALIEQLPQEGQTDHWYDLCMWYLGNENSAEARRIVQKIPGLLGRGALEQVEALEERQRAQGPEV